ncbi:tetratricopeptide repeat protein [Flavobacteriales bacterium]|nr:tetratricopeptide repeat protein [Flavobacteriales bacterium]
MIKSVYSYTIASIIGLSIVGCSTVSNSDDISEPNQSSTPYKFKYYTDLDTVVIETEIGETLSYTQAEYNTLVYNHPEFYSGCPKGPDNTYSKIKPLEGEYFITSETGQDTYYMLYAQFLKMRNGGQLFDNERRRLIEIYLTINMIHGTLVRGGSYFGHQIPRILAYAEWSLYNKTYHHKSTAPHDIENPKFQYINCLKEFIADQIDNDPKLNEGYLPELDSMVNELHDLITNRFYLDQATSFELEHYRHSNCHEITEQYSDRKEDTSLQKIASVQSALNYVFLNLDSAYFKPVRTDWKHDYGLKTGAGTLNTFEYVRSILTYKQLQYAITEKIFLKGPHTASKLNLNSSNSFGHYNPKFVQELHSGLNELSSSKDFVEATRPAIIRFDVLKKLNQYLEVHSIIEDNECEFMHLRNNYEKQLKTGEWCSNGYRQNLPSNIITLGRNWAATIYYFWIRREIDGTRDLWIEIIRDLANAYLDTDKLLDDAYLHYESQEFEESLELFKSIAELSPDNLQAKKGIAFCHARMLNYSEANNRFKQISVIQSKGTEGINYVEFRFWLQELVAVTNDTFYSLVPWDYTTLGTEYGECIDVEQVGDFNGNGYEDVLIENRRSCEGSIGYSEYQAFTFNGNEFEKSESVRHHRSFHTTDIDGVTHFIIDSHMPGNENYRVDTFKLVNSELKLVNP